MTGPGSVTHRLFHYRPAAGPSTDGTQVSETRGWSCHVFFCWECWWAWEVSANPQRLLEVCFSWTWPDQPAEVRLLVLRLVLFQEGRRCRKIVLRGAPAVKGPRHAHCILWVATAFIYCIMNPGCGAIRGAGLWGRAGGYWDRKWFG